MTNSSNIFLILSRILLFFTPSILLLSCAEKKVEEDSNIETINSSEKKHFKILILGDSLTEGFGVDESDCYPALLEYKLNTEMHSKTGKNYKVINGGISGSTTSGGVSRIEWFLRSKPDFLILALGGNDGLRGIPVEKIKENLEKVVLAAKENGIPTLLAGMKIPPNYGLAYSLSFSQLFPTLADTFDIPLIPFLLEGVGGNPEMNLPDRIHPNARGHKLICEIVYQALSPILE